MKKLFTAFLAFVLVASLCVCGTSAFAVTPAKVVETGSGITVKTAEEWKEQFPEIYESYMKNMENKDTTDYVEDYPMIGKLYEGMGFSKFYDSARGHNYTVTDITNTGRPHKLANCFTCKSPNMTVMVNNEGNEVYSREADENFVAQLTEPISCYNCHANEAGTLVVTHTYLSDAMGEDLDKVDAANLSCAQCHNEYYFNPTDKATTLPYSNLATMTPDAILDFYNNTLLVDGQPFADYTNSATGVRQIKVQHPEFETFMGEGSVHASMFTCADCHMGQVTSEDGVTYTSHYLTSPLENDALIESTCAACHGGKEGLTTMVKGIQEKMEERTYEIGYRLEELQDKLAEAIASGEYTEEELDAIRALDRDAQFYWDFVFVENSEGAHNSKLDNKCLDKATEILDQAFALFK